MASLRDCVCVLTIFVACVRGFEDDGVSSFLQQSVQFDESWTEVSGWKMDENTGFFNFSTKFPPKFLVRNAGIYYVSGNFWIKDTNVSLVRASIAVNERFDEPNGLTARFGNTTANGTVSLSGLLLLYENDVVSVAIKGSEGTLLKFSTFSVLRLAQIGTVPGLHVVLSREVKGSLLTKRLEDWRTSGTKGLFQALTGFSPSTGKFCAIFDGLYKYASNINFKSVQDKGNSTILLVLNEQSTIVRYYASGSGRHTGSIDGLLHLRKGDCIQLNIYSEYQVSKDSSFSALYLGAEQSSIPAFSARLSNLSQVKQSVDWWMISGWNDVSSQGYFESKSEISNRQKTFKVAEKGFYLVSALLNFEISDSMDNSQIFGFITIVDQPSGADGSGGLLATKSASLGNTSINVRGVLSLNKDNILKVYLRQEGGATIARDFSGFFSASLITYDYVGVSATLNTDKRIEVSDWIELRDWQTSVGSGLYPLHETSLTASGRYQIYLDGTYFVSSNVIMNSTERASLEALIAVDQVVDPSNGLYSHEENVTGYRTLNVMGSLNLHRGQNVSVFVRVGQSASWMVRTETSLSVALIGARRLEDDGVPGFFAVKNGTDAFTTNAWTEIVGWSTTEEGKTVFQTGTAFIPETGRFTSPLPSVGIYLISANILVSHHASASFKLQVRISGNANLKPISIGRPEETSSGKGILTLSTSGTAKLSSSNAYLSVFVKAGSNIRWSVERNSSVSIALIKEERSDDFAGFRARGVGEINDVAGVRKVPNFWTVDQADYQDVFDEDVKVFPGQFAFGYAEIPISGLYYVESVVEVVKKSPPQSSDPIAIVSVCVDGNFSKKGVIAFERIDTAQWSIITFGVFGVLYLRKGQKLSVCFESQIKQWRINENSIFSIVRILPWKRPPGLQQQHTGAPPAQNAALPIWSTNGFTSQYKRGSIVEPIKSAQFMKSRLKLARDGIYLISVSFLVHVEVISNEGICIGSEECSSCELELFPPVGKGSATIGLVRFLNLTTGTDIYTCVNFSQSSARNVTFARRSVQLLTLEKGSTLVELTHNSASSDAGGWQKITQWLTLQGIPPILTSGLYIVALDILVRSQLGHNVSVKVETSNSKIPQVLHATTTLSGTSNISFSATGLARATKDDVFSVLVFSGNSQLVLPDVRFSFVKIREDTGTCFALKQSHETRMNVTSEWWAAIEGWDTVDLGCLPNGSDEKGGRFVNNRDGVYYVAATVRFRLPSAAAVNSREFCLELSVDVSSGDRLKAVKTVRIGDFVTLAVTSTVYLTALQTVSLSVKSDGVLDLIVLENSTFYVALLDEDRHFKARRHDNGPRAVINTPAFVALPSDLGRDIQWRCAVVPLNQSTLKWLKDNQVISSSMNLFRQNVNVNDSGRYFCVAESNNISVASQATELEVYDTRPIFKNGAYTVKVLENKNISETFYFTARNSNNKSANVSGKILGNLDDIFEIFPNTAMDKWTLRNIKSLDYERRSSYIINISATNNDTLKSTLISVTIDVEDVNDNVPKFSRREYIFTVPENASQGAFVGQMKATDNDLSANPVIGYNLFPDGSGQPFGIDEITGNVTVNGTLDRETNGSYNFVVKASDVEHSTFANLSIIVLDVNDNPPVFSQKHYNGSIMENATVGAFVLQVSAVDKDIGADAKVVYTFVGSSRHFSINETTGIVTVNRSLDRETNDSYNFVAKASDGEHSTTANLSIIVLDVNDNLPVFSKNHYNGSIMENARIGAFVLQVSVSDYDVGANAAVVYSFEGSSRHFRINGTTGIVTVNRSLDRETNDSYNFVVKASDGEHSTTANLSIIVLDVNDNLPVFSKKHYNSSIMENARIDAFVLQVSASDNDVGANAAVVYSFEGSSRHFSINETTGIVTVNRSLDRETNDSYNFVVKASDGEHSTTANLSIIVLDVNDNLPVFSKKHYNGSIMENARIGAFVLQVSASDNDVGANAAVVYSFEGSSRHFSINETTGIVTVNRSLDRETNDSYNFVVKASDGEHSTTANLSIIVLDVNDNLPVFSKKHYNGSIMENARIGAFVLQVSASDNDVGDNAAVVYSFEGSSRHFRINGTTGIVTVNRSLDRETNDSYNFVVKASDGEHSTTANLSIIVLDVNDNLPVFSKKHYNGSIMENARIGAFVLQVSASDNDVGANAAVVYSFEGSSRHFRINGTTGIVTVNRRLDRETNGSYNFVAKASDGEHSTTANLSITVLDVNDNLPVFSKKHYNGSIMENARIGAFVLQVSASDNDVGANAAVVYSFEGSSRHFRINGTTGIVTVNISLDRETNDSFDLVVKASNGEHSTFANLSIIVLDVNDNPPIFSNEHYDASIMANAAVGAFVIQVFAEDDDIGANAEIAYKFEGNGEPFKINKTSGNVAVNASLELQQYNLNVTASDGVHYAKATLDVEVSQKVTYPAGREGTLDGGEIAAIAVGILIGLVICIACLIKFVRRKRNRTDSYEVSQKNIRTSNLTVLESKNSEDYFALSHIVGSQHITEAKSSSVEPEGHIDNKNSKEIEKPAS